MADDQDVDLNDPAQARAYLNNLSAHSSRRGDTSYLHPDFAVRLANAVQQARAAGLPVTLQSGYRTNDTTGSAYDAAGFSLHGVGAAADIGGIGAAGSPQSQQWAKIAAQNGLANPYGADNAREFNHWQLVPWKLENRPDIQKALAASGGDLGKTWGAIQPVSSDALAYSAPDAAGTSSPASKAIVAMTVPRAKPPTAAPTMSDDEILKTYGLGGDSSSADLAPAPKPAAKVPAPSVAARPSSLSDDDILKAYNLGGGDTASSGSVTPQEAGKPFLTDPATGYVVSRNEAGYTSLTDPKSGRVVQQFAPDDYEARASRLGAFVGGATKDIPLVGPAIAGGIERAAAATRGVQNDQPFSQNLAAVQGDAARDAAVYPKTNVAGGLTGATLALGPVGGTEAGALALGMRGANSARMFWGGLSGAGLGAGDAAVRGDNPVVGGTLGLVGGGLVGPLAGHVLGGVANRLTDAAHAVMPTGIPGVSRSAANLANRVIDWSGGHEAVANQANRFGPMAMIADADPSLTAIAGGLAAKPGEAQGIVRNALTERAADSSERIGNTLTDVVGPDRSNVALDNAYKEIRAANGAIYNDIHAAAPPVDASGVVRTIDNLLETATGNQRKALQNIRSELVETPETATADGTVIPEQYHSNSRILHNIRQDIDATLDGSAPGLGVQAGAVNRTSASVVAARNALDEAMKRQIPGLAEADARSALDAANIDAVKQGYGSVLGGNVPHPGDFAATLAANDPETNIALGAGMASRMHRAFGVGTQRDAVTLNKLLAGGEEGYSAQNIRAAFGDKAANALLDTLERERAFNNTTNAVIGNSETARRTAANKLLDETQPGGLSVLNASTAGMIAQPVKSLLVDPLVKMVMENPTAPRNVELARILTAQGDQRGVFLQQLQRLAGRNALTDAIGRPAAAALNTGANRLLYSAGVSQRPAIGQ